MTFEELRLSCAIRKAMVKFGSSDVVSTTRKLELSKAVHDERVLLYQEVFFPFTTDQVCGMYTNHKKQGSNAVLAADIAMAHSMFKCFWSNRGKGPCSNDVHAGHVVPNVHGAELSVPNGIIECSYHNCSRSTKTIEEYVLVSDEGAIP